MWKIFKICCMGLVTALTMQCCQSRKMSENKYFLLVGTYTDGNASEGIYVYNFDDTSGQMTEVAHTNHVANPSYMALSDNGKYLYAVNENDDSKAKGMISGQRTLNRRLYKQ